MITTTRSGHPRALFVGAALVGFASLSIAACSDSAALSGQSVIEDELAEEIGLGDLDAECNEPDGLEEGETFTCTATTEDDRTILFLGTMTSEDTFDIVTTNLLTAEDVAMLEESGAEALSDEVGATVTADDITCPDGVILLDEAGEYMCEITDSATGDVYELTVTLGEFEPGVGFGQPFFQIGDLVS